MIMTVTKPMLFLKTIYNSQFNCSVPNECATLYITPILIQPFVCLIEIEIHNFLFKFEHCMQKKNRLIIYAQSNHTMIMHSFSCN